jgi:hypothetical protein
MPNNEWLKSAELSYPGWWPLVNDLHKKLSYIDPEYQITQIKEKFGTLRYYYFTNIEDPMARLIMRDLVLLHERSSENLCEQCGAGASLKKMGHWLVTRCDNCMNKLDNWHEYKSGL